MKKSVTTSVNGKDLDKEQEALQKYNLIFNGNPAPMAVSSLPERRFTEVNDAFLKTLGYSRAEIIGRNSVELGIFVEPEKQREIANELQAHGRIANRELKLKRKDGTIIEGLFSGELIARQGQRFFLTVMIDQTERKRAEEALRESEARYRALLDNAAEGIIVADLQTRQFRYANPAMCRMFGYTEVELRKMWLTDIHPEESLDDVQSRFDAITVSAKTATYDVQCRRKNGEVFYADINGAPLILDGHKCALGLFSDNTGRKLAELEREKMAAQLRQVQKLESIGLLAGGVAHDFNNKLMVIQWNTEMILNGLAQDDPIRDELIGIKQAALHSVGLTRQLLAFSRMQAIAPAALDLNAVITDSLQMLGRLIGENIRLTFAPHPGIGCVFMDPTQVDQILMNLAANARDAICGSGKINITLENVTLREPDCRGRLDFVTPGQYVTLIFHDDGPGIPPDIQARIFEPFFTTKELGRGVGLGLATVYGIVKQNQGAITLCSAPGQGTAFTIYLPCLDCAAMESAEAPAPQLSNGAETILVIDDELSILEMVRRMLTRHGYTVLAAAAPEAALTLCARHKAAIDLLLTDVIMPDMGGKDMAERIRAIHPDIRILYMSGYPGDIMEKHGHLPEGMRVLRKPFTIQQLTQQIRAALDDPRAG
jgi:PAS domain S-box-containing protein